MVKKAREGVMEFLLINHPLDCPICDQGGECDLQDQAMAYGFDAYRFSENKRAVEDKYLGPLVKTFMTRCIHCTRCVRFMTEVAGVADLGAIGRGEDMEITTYLEHGMSSRALRQCRRPLPRRRAHLQALRLQSRAPGNSPRPKSIDVMDALGSNIRVDSRGREVMRILPRVNDDVNEEWISDKTRHVWDGLRTSGSTGLMSGVTGKLEPASWGEAFAAIARKLKGLDGERMARDRGRPRRRRGDVRAQASDEQLGSPNIDCRQDGAKLDPALRPRHLSLQRHHRRHRSRPTPSCSWAPIRAATRRCSMPASRKRWRQAQGRLHDRPYRRAGGPHLSYEHLGAGVETLAQSRRRLAIRFPRRQKEPSGR